MSRADYRRKVRSKKRFAREIFEHLQSLMIDVECGECHATFPAQWQQDVAIWSEKDWVAVSHVRCLCGCAVTSFMGAGPNFEHVCDFPSRHKRTTTGDVISSALRPGWSTELH